MISIVLSVLNGRAVPPEEALETPSTQCVSCPVYI